MKAVGIKVDLVGNTKQSAKDVFNSLEQIGYTAPSSVSVKDVKIKKLSDKYTIFIGLRKSYKDESYWIDMTMYRTNLGRFVDMEEIEVEPFLEEVNKICSIDSSSELEWSEIK